MNNQIQQQIDSFTAKIHYYEDKKSRLYQRIQILEAERKNVDALKVGDPLIENFYKTLDNVYSQWRTLPAKIRKCNDKIITLKCEL